MFDYSVFWWVLDCLAICFSSGTALPDAHLQEMVRIMCTAACQDWVPCLHSFLIQQFVTLMPMRGACAALFLPQFPHLLSTTDDTLCNLNWVLWFGVTCRFTTVLVLKEVGFRVRLLCNNNYPPGCCARPW